MKIYKKQVFLAGNPNSGKTTLFNTLTGLRQHVGNYPGVTVDKKSGQLTGHGDITVVDLPGTYSLYPNSLEEKIVTRQLLDIGDQSAVILYAADCSRLDSQLLLLTQIIDLGHPVVLALTMTDREDKYLDESTLSESLGIPVFKVSSKSGEGIERLKSNLVSLVNAPVTTNNSFYNLSDQEQKLAAALEGVLPEQNSYRRLQFLHHGENVAIKDQIAKDTIDRIRLESGFNSVAHQIEETLQRFNKLDRILAALQIGKTDTVSKRITHRMDQIITHPVAGPVIFALIMLLVFQAVFTWATVPMDAIESIIAVGANSIDSVFPESWLRNLITRGFIPGLAGVLVFIPQIAILFLLIGALEESGYMARVVTMFDAMLKPLGLNGRSVVAFVSGGACAIPAIMSTRTITNQRERLITILVTPFISCSARIPVYSMLVAFAVTEGKTFGFDNRAFALFGLYAIGVLMALLAAWILKAFIKGDERSSLMMELPVYRSPSMKSLVRLAYEKTKVFILEAGKIILIISMVLWFLSSYGWNREENLVSDPPLAESFAGNLGHAIEPVIRPLGFDWKIGIAIISSFAAREVFVGTMATLYAIEDEEHVESIKERMKLEVFPDTGKPVYSQPGTWSLLLFYAFAMQCMSTLAVVKRETRTWKWPLIQLVFMTGIAYLAAFVIFHLLS